MNPCPICRVVLDDLFAAVESMRGERDAARAHTEKALEAEQKARAELRELRRLLVKP